MTGQPPDAIVVQRALRAPPAVVFDAWLDADAMADWMCPHPARATNVEVDAHIGGRYRIDIDDAGFALSITGEYLVLDRPRRLSFTWSSSTWKPNAPDSIVTVELEPRGDDETLMTIRHERIPPDVVEGHGEGWRLIARQLGERIEASKS